MYEKTHLFQDCKLRYLSFHDPMTQTFKEGSSFPDNFYTDPPLKKDKQNANSVSLID